MRTKIPKQLAGVVVHDRNKVLLRQHYPWVFGRSVKSVPENTPDGSVVPVFNEEGEFIAYGFYNSRSQIRIKLFEWREERFDLRHMIKEKINQAYLFRHQVLNITKQTDAYRLINGEGDFLPGLIVDIYSKSAVVQVNLLAFYQNIDLIGDSIREKGIVERILVKTDENYAEKEGFELREHWIIGGGSGREVIRDGDLNFIVDLLGAQKTGFYLDQRDNRRIVRELAADKKVLDCFCFSGAFAIWALKGGASKAICVDSSARALELAQQNLRLNQCTAKTIRANAFDFLKACWTRGEKFDLIVLDPPKFAPKKKDYTQAMKGYFELNRMAIEILTQHGILVSCSCSQQVDEESFITVLNKAAVSVNREMKIIAVRAQSPDHTFVPSCPETRYLKCIVCEIE
jgi:23S rRNA (cytosine1962-C5)-methyltransferase